MVTSSRVLLPQLCVPFFKPAMIQFLAKFSSYIMFDGLGGGEVVDVSVVVVTVDIGVVDVEDESSGIVE